MNTSNAFVRLVGVTSLLICASASADPASDKLAEAQGLYDNRIPFAQTDVAKAETERGIQLLDQAAAEASDPLVKYDALILNSRFIYWKGIHITEKEVKLETFLAAMDKAKAATEINADLADSYYYAGIALARWAQTKGPLAAIGRKDELFGLMEQTIARDTRTGDLGEEIDGYGPNRVYGRVYHELPGFLGGSHEKAVDYLSAAFTNAASLALNVVYYADALYDGNSSERQQACVIINDLLSKDEKTYNPSRPAETAEEFADARELKRKINCQ